MGTFSATWQMRTASKRAREHDPASLLYHRVIKLKGPLPKPPLVDLTVEFPSLRNCCNLIVFA